MQEGEPGDGEKGHVSREKLQDEDRLDDAGEEVGDFLEGLLDALGIEGTVEVAVERPERVAASITGRESGLLIGRKGKTLEALQELARAVVQRQVGFGIKVQLDVEGYRERRRQMIQGLAEEMIEEARETGEAELEPMSAYERKIVHDLVAEHEGVTSFSEGEGPDRRVIIRSTSPGSEE